MDDRGRVVILSSSLHRISATFNFDDIMSTKSYSLFGTYSQTKLANVLMGYELQRRLTAKKSSVTCNVVHPGTVATDVSRHMGSIMTFLEKLVWPLLLLLRKTPLQGAYSSLYAVTSPELDTIGGKYIFNSKCVNSSPVSYDEQIAQKLWLVSEKLTKIVE